MEYHGISGDIKESLNTVGCNNSIVFMFKKQNPHLRIECVSCKITVNNKTLLVFTQTHYLSHSLGTHLLHKTKMSVTQFPLLAQPPAEFPKSSPPQFVSLQKQSAAAFGWPKGKRASPNSTTCQVLCQRPKQNLTSCSVASGRNQFLGRLTT